MPYEGVGTEPETHEEVLRWGRRNHLFLGGKAAWRLGEIGQEIRLLIRNQ